MSNEDSWPATLPVVQVRVARPTERLAEVVRFYHEGIGLPVVDRFSGHAGYDGVMLGLPGKGYHLEFTQHEGGAPCPAPTEDNLLVLYLPNLTARNAIAQRLASLGYPPVSPENPYWAEHGLTIADPDGWRVVLMGTEGI